MWHILHNAIYVLFFVCFFNYFIVIQLRLSAFSPHYPFLPPLWLLFDCSWFQCLQLYFVCFFSFVDYFISCLIGIITPFFKDFIYLFLERGEGREKRKEPMYGSLSHAPYWGPGPQPRHVPWLGIQPATLWFAGWHSIHLATPARVQNFLTCAIFMS